MFATAEENKRFSLFRVDFVPIAITNQPVENFQISTICLST